MIMIDIMNPRNPTSHQMQVGELWAMSRSDAQIAARLGISIRTVQNHVKAFYEATGCENHSDVFDWFWRKVWHKSGYHNYFNCANFVHGGTFYNCSLPADDYEITINE
jgi:DNA-binding CsgD family transcriptional regulator